MSYIIQVIYLLLANCGRFIIPILFLPLSSRLLSPHDFESLSVTISFATWIAIVIEFGFNYSAAKQIKYNSSDKRILAVINSTLSAKFILSLFGVALGSYTAYYVDKCNALFVLIFWLYSFFVGAMLSFVYICRNNNKRLLKIEFIGGCLFSVFISLMWILKTESFYIIFGSLVLYRAIVFLLSIFYLRREVDLKKIKLSLRSGIRAIKKSYAYAIFQISSSIYLYGLSFIASMVIDKKIVIFHLLAERVFKLLTFGFAPVSRVMFSFLNNSGSKDKSKAIFFLCVFSVVSGVLGWVCLHYLSMVIITVFFGNEFLLAYINLNVLAIALPFAFLNGIMSVSGFLSKGRLKYLNVVIMLTGCIIMPVCYALSYYTPMLAASISYVIAESFISILLLFQFIPYLLKEKRNES